MKSYMKGNCDKLQLRFPTNQDLEIEAFLLYFIYCVYWLVLCQLDTAGVITEKGASVEEMPP